METFTQRCRNSEVAIPRTRTAGIKINKSVLQTLTLTLLSVLSFTGLYAKKPFNHVATVCGFSVTSTAVYDAATNRTTFTWQVYNTNPGNGSNQTFQDLSHFTMGLATCMPSYMPNFVNNSGRINGGSAFNPSYNDDKSSDCSGSTDVLKFDAGTRGSDVTTYSVQVQGNVGLAPVTAYFKSGNNSYGDRNCCSGTIMGIGCPVVCPTVTLNPISISTTTPRMLSVTANVSLATGYTYLWTASGGVAFSSGGTTSLTSTSAMPTIVVTNAAIAGNVTVVVTSTTNSTCTYTRSRTFSPQELITICSIPAPEITATTVSRCGPGDVTFSALCTGGRTEVYSAEVGGTLVLVANSTTFTIPAVQQTTDYFVQCANPGTGCVSPRVKITVQINQAPALTVTTNATNNTVCVGQNVTLNAAAPGFTLTNVMWTSTNTQVQAAINGNVLNTSGLAAGTYRINVSANVNGCPATGFVDIVVNAIPTATINYAGGPFCPTGTVAVTRTGAAGGTFSAAAGLMINATTGEINLATSTPGTYTVTYSVTVNGCTGTATTQVVINARPAASIAYVGGPFCPSGTANVTIAGQTGGTFSSTAGLSINATTGAINLGTSTPGTYTVTYTFSANGCTNTATVQVVINAAPTATINYAGGPFCPTGNAAVTVTGQTGGTFSSTAGLSINATTGAINLAASTPGTYTVTYNFTVNGCAGSATTQVVINAIPTATISYAGPFCPTGTAAVTRTGTAGGTFSSTTGLMINSTTGEINLATSTPGTYTVTYSFSANGCNATATTVVVINARPVATIAYAGPFCPTGSATPTMTGQMGGTFSSTAGLNINATTGVINLATSTPGTYTVTYSFSANGCTNTTTTQVVINAAPTATINYAGGPFCPTGNAAVTVTGQTGGTFSSTAGLSINATTGAINLAASTPGTYVVTYSFSANGCTSSTTATVVINAIPTATIVYANGPFCPTGSVEVTRTGTAGGTFSAGAGLSINTTTGAINLATSTPGTYTVTYSFSANGCANTATTQVVINARPNATIAYAGPFCPVGNAAVTITGTTGGTFSAGAGLNINASTGAINLAASTPGTYTVTYTFSANGCTNTTTTQVVVNAIPSATIAYAGPFCPVGSAMPTMTGTMGGTFSSTAGLNINASTGMINLAASTPGTYVVTYSFSANGCANTTTATVVINPIPTATISYAGGPFCPAGSVVVVRTGAAGGTFSAGAGLSINASTGEINLANSTAGTYTVTYSFSVNGCANTATTQVVINATPGVPSVTNIQRCGPGEVTLTATGCNGGILRWYDAQTGGTPLATGSSYTVSVTTNRVFYVSCVINGCESARVAVSVTLLQAPNVNFTLSGGSYCVGGQGVQVILSGSQLGFNYQLVRDGINVGNAVPGTGNAINFGFQTAAGTYTVIAVTSNAQNCVNPCVATIGSATIVINQIPTATISYAGPFCPVGTAAVTRTGTAGGTFSSTAGLMINATTGEINLATSTPGTYTVTYNFSANGCNGSATTVVVINPRPVATISYAGPFCPVGTANVTMTGQMGGTFSSTAGLSINATTGAINLATSTPGTYTVTYSFSANGCANTATTVVVINATPVATIAYAGPFCPTGSATPTMTGQMGGTFSSTTGLSINATTGVINLAASTAGTYVVTYSFSANGCASSTTTTVVINANPVATISYAGPFCPVGTAAVTRTGTAGGTFSSTAGLMINATTGEINLATSTPGTYTVTYNFSANGCNGSATTVVVINPRPVATISYAGPFCPVGTANVTMTGQMGGTFSSTAGLSINATTGAINLATSTPGTYTVTYSFSANGCANTATTVVVINATPVATIAYAGPFCPTGSATPTMTGQMGGTFSSTAGLNINATTGMINLALSTPGTYTVTYSFSANGCANTATTVVVINANPVATINYAGGPFCPTGSVEVTRTGAAGGTFTSTAGLSINATTGAINLATSNPGTYTVTYSFSANGCAGSTTTTVVINPRPVATIAYAGPFCPVGTVMPTMTGQMGGTFSSTAGLNINATTGMINLALSTPGTYTVTYSFSANGCANTATTVVVINATPVATIAYAGPFCPVGTVMPTMTGQMGGTFSSTTGLSINASTGMINLANSTPGTYVVTYSFSANGCANSTTTTVVINAIPTATISYAGPFCPTGNAAVTITGQAGGTFSSTTGLNINATTGLINLGTSTPGTYTVTYSFSANGCTNSTSTQVVINATPTATISYAGPFCPVGTASVTRTGVAGGTFTSTTGLVINGTTGEINLATSTPGTYTVTYSFSANGCANSTTTQVVINARPVATIAYAGPFCPVGSATPTMTGQMGGTFSAGAGLSINASTGVINLANSTPGTYTVTYNFSANGCANSTTTVVVINARPTASISYAGPFCPTGNASVAIIGQTGGTFSSTAGLNINATTGLINLAASTPGTYVVTYSFSANGCSNTATTTVVINNPVCNITGPSVLCVGQQGTYTAPVGATNITWTVTSSNCEIVSGSNSATLVVRATGAGTATIRLNAIVNGCPVQCEITVTVNPGPIVNRAEYSLCPTTQGGNTAVFNLNLPELANVITGSVSGVSVTGYFTTFDAAAANVAGTQISNPGSYTSPTTTIYARVLQTGGCVSIARVDLIVRSVVIVTGRTSDDCSARIGLAGTTGRVAQQSGDAGSLNVIASPNPFSDRIRFNIQSDFSGQGTLEVFNTLGAKIKTVFQGPVVAGQSQTVDFAVPSAQRVNLVYVMTVGNRQTTGKVINLK